MTPSEREEIEKVAKKVCKGIPGSLHDIPACEIRHIKCKRCEKIEQAIITQVEKARAEERERCAKIAEMYVIEFGNTGMHFKTLHGDKIASAIRDKLEKE